jgi:Holliday junction resolvasome RuvABC endonuclease subunit
MHALGIDPSLTKTGLAAVDLATREWGTALIKSEGHKGDNLNARWLRMVNIRLRIKQAIESLGDNILIAAIEGPSYNSKFGSPWDRGGLWWMIVDDLRGQGIPVALVPPPNRAMYATGNGGSGKAAVFRESVKRYPVNQADHNVGDAVVIAAMAARWTGYPVDDLPELHTRALEGCEWP